MPSRVQTVLIAGGGPAALEAALGLRAFGGGRLRVALITPSPVYVHRPVSVAEPFVAGVARSYSLDAVRDLGIQVHAAVVAGVDTAAGRVLLGDGRELAHDHLVMATGAEALPWLPRSVTFAGRPDDVAAVRAIKEDLDAGRARSVALVVPPHSAWSLPAYELALQLAPHGQVSLHTAEAAPLEVFGPTVSAALAERLTDAGVRFTADPPDADRTIALPVLWGRRLPGLPCDAEGFLPVDEHGRVAGLDRVYAAGDGAAHPIKQGGLGTQQAEAAAEAIAVAAGVREAATPYRGVLRAKLVTGGKPLYLRRRLDAPDGELSERCLWWPAGKIAGQRLAPFLDSLEDERPPVRLLGVVGR